MATESVVQDVMNAALRGNEVYTESSAYERIVARLNGLNAISALANCVIEGDVQPTALVWQPLWFALGLTTEDIQRDLNQMWREQTLEDRA